MAIATAQRWPYARTISAALNGRSVVKKAAMAGGGFLWPRRFVAGGPCGRRTPPRTRRPGPTAGHGPSQAWLSAPASLGWGVHPVVVCARVVGEPLRSPFWRGAPRRFGIGGGGTSSSLALIGKRPTTWAAWGNCRT